VQGQARRLIRPGRGSPQLAYAGVSDAVARTSLERLAGQMAQEFMQTNSGTNLHPDQ
jgi:hypothetical protein